MRQPDTIYQRIEGTRWRHVWVVGDIHGCFSMLMDKLRQCRFDPWQDLLVSVGDVIDRGPDSLRCLALLPEAWVVAVRGNHEQMALDALASGIRRRRNRQPGSRLKSVSDYPGFWNCIVSMASMSLRMLIIRVMNIAGKKRSIYSRYCGIAPD